MALHDTPWGAHDDLIVTGSRCRGSVVTIPCQPGSSANCCVFYYLSLVKLIVVDSGDQFVQMEQLLLVGSLAWLGIRQLRASATRRVFNLSLSENLTDLFLNVLIPL